MKSSRYLPVTNFYSEESFRLERIIKKNALNISAHTVIDEEKELNQFTKKACSEEKSSHWHLTFYYTKTLKVIKRTTAPTGLKKLRNWQNVQREVEIKLLRNLGVHATIFTNELKTAWKGAGPVWSLAGSWHPS